ncbi:uncharacterized protein CANTADRAFT_87794 [Suhomyces tanzawaensis NRRL Y-17324]|uniref:Uncharacterized protein n=1 Tax=Suhomyces tanzawaensis NRRL Y-17324 TaxID=984487 RepID=A0A1E4SQP3_9ASCO|nr:uncharacterized protein CANTADRAFT_87794 [Suhomyces tanzawaensis NRRL Y-17324]ODV81833.1 hypothetical protein CANTADRAFT_87794 [Suhomyces tanzawaensis NRRL Y-17324]
MAPKIREDLVVPYKHVAAKKRSEASGMIAQSLPMAAMFMRNKLLSWSAFFLAVQSYLNEPINAPSDDSVQQPPLLRIVFAVISMLTCYMDIVFPNSSPQAKRSFLQNAAETATAAAATATS